ncbi:MAG TPA: DUF4386 domain-containing protein [Chthoniobacterales bacterium]|jgi:hypothetical protein|nr:DUF4386 domain-containing protein [Chthoniobacterales bacterium]
MTAKEWSPKAKARLAGVFEVLEGSTSAWGQVTVLGWLIVVGNASATAANILQHETLFRLGFASSLFGVVFHLAWAFLFYQLFKPVSRSVSLCALLVILVCCTLQALSALLYLAPLVVLTAGSSLSALNQEQLQALAYMFPKLNGLAFDTTLVFFGLWCVLTGYLIFKSTFLPRILGVLLAIDGLGWMMFMWPPLGHYLFPIIAVACGLAEIPLELWLLIFGVNNERWKAQAEGLTAPNPTGDERSNRQRATIRLPLFL